MYTKTLFICSLPVTMALAPINQPLNHLFPPLHVSESGRVQLAHGPSGGR